MVKADDKLPQGMIKTWNIPQQWAWLTLNDIAEWGSGGTPKSSQSEYYDGDIPWLIIADLNDGVVTKSAKTITELGLKNSSAKLVEKGSILIAMYGSIGKLAIAGIDCTTNQAIAFTKSILEEVETKYLFYYLRRIRQELLDVGKGGTQANISQTVLKQVEIPIAPLNEQKRIVAKLERLLAKVNESCDRLSRIPTILKRFRQSVLASACSGRLTADWRKSHPNIEPAEKLLKHISDVQIDTIERFDGFDYPEDWEIVISKQLFSFVTSGSRGWAKYYANEGHLFIRVGNLNHDTIDVDFSSIQKVKLPEQVEGKRTKVEENDILISITADTGMIGLIVNNIPESYINQHIALARPIKGLNYKYLAWFLASNNGQKQFRELQRGATKAGLGLDDIKSLYIAIPPLEEQKEIVRKVEALFRKCDLIEQRYLKAKAYTDKLTQSILAKAFRGELVPQDSNDEPAEVLLERIRQEKTLTDKSSKSKKTSKSKST